MDLVWVAWTPKKARRAKHPSTYTGLLALTAERARKLLNNFDAWLPRTENFDVALRQALCENIACRAEPSAGYLASGDRRPSGRRQHDGGRKPHRHHVDREAPHPRHENDRAHSRSFFHWGVQFHEDGPHLLPPPWDRTPRHIPGRGLQVVDGGDHHR